jgi:hypothetical protein
VLQLGVVKVKLGWEAEKYLKNCKPGKACEILQNDGCIGGVYTTMGGVLL